MLFERHAEPTYLSTYLSGSVGEDNLSGLGRALVATRWRWRHGKSVREIAMRMHSFARAREQVVESETVVVAQPLASSQIATRRGQY